MYYIETLFVNMHKEMPFIFYAYFTIIGLAIGSFLNVVIYRLPIMLERAFKDEYDEYFHPEKERPIRPVFNLITPRSRCPNCGHMITAIENIPVLSFLFLGGKCKKCKTKISIRYPLVELFTGIMTLAVSYIYGPTIQMLAVLILVWGLIAISGIDFDKQIIPDEIVLPLLWVGILANTYSHGIFVDLETSVYGAVFGYMIPWLIYWIYKVIRHKEGMGYGDFKLYACLGAWLGVYMLPAIIFISCVLGAIFGGILLLNRKKDIPFSFGPYISIAGFIVLVWGERINALYLTMLYNI